MICMPSDLGVLTIPFAMHRGMKQEESAIYTQRSDGARRGTMVR